MSLLRGHLKNERGATSVLIMVMMIILMVFGLAALTTSAASKKLAQKNTKWLTEYYALEGQAVIAYADLVEALNLNEVMLDSDKLVQHLEEFENKNENVEFSWEETSESEKPFKINLMVKEQREEVPKNTQMKFEIEKKENQFYLKTVKWIESQEDIFNEEDEIQFEDIIPGQ